MLTNRRKIVHKASAWSAHGKHKGLLILCIQQNRERRDRQLHPTRMYETVPEMMLAENKYARK